MLNPLVDSLSQFTDPQLDSKITELQRKYFQTRNSGLQAQIANLLEIYKEEQYCRRAISAQKQREENNLGGKGLDSLINIS